MQRLIECPIATLACRLAIAAGLGCALAAVPVRAADEPETQDWIAKFQSTYVWQGKPAFSAPYTGSHSLIPERERSYTLTATAYLGMRAWQGAELYYNPELIQSNALSDLTGLGGLSNGENQKGSGTNPKVYNARYFLRQTWKLDDEDVGVDAGLNQLAGPLYAHRLVLTAGKIALLDIFDNNAFSHDPRTQFMNWSLMTYGGWDYAADSRGYSIGAALEYYRGAWVFRAARFEQPKESNGLPLDSRIMAHHGDQIEVEHGHEIAGQPGKLRFLVFRNAAKMGGFRDAIAYAHANGGTPDVGNVRNERVKRGLGLALEQNVTRNVGFFTRASWNDDQSETYAFTEIGNSLSGVLSIKGAAWGRPADTVGLACVTNGLSSAHRDYLALGGHGFFIGDGALNYRREQIAETYYSIGVTKNTWRWATSES
jgi:high affinity Mn2+ porin